MASSFDVLMEELPEYAEKGKYAEKVLYEDGHGDTCIRDIGTASELIAKELTACSGINFSEKGKQDDRVRSLKSHRIIPGWIYDNFQTIRPPRNDASHDGYGDKDTAEKAISKYFEICVWYAGYINGRKSEHRQYAPPSGYANGQHLSGEALTAKVVSRKIERLVSAQENLVKVHVKLLETETAYKQTFTEYQDLNDSLERLERAAAEEEFYIKETAIGESVRPYLVPGGRYTNLAKEMISQASKHLEEASKKGAFAQKKDAETRKALVWAKCGKLNSDLKNLRSAYESAKDAYETARKDILSESDGRQYLALHEDKAAAALLEPERPASAISRLKEELAGAESESDAWMHEQTQYHAAEISAGIIYLDARTFGQAIVDALSESRASGTISTEKISYIKSDIDSLIARAASEKNLAAGMRPEITKKINEARTAKRAARIAYEEEQKKQGLIATVSYGYEEDETPVGSFEKKKRSPFGRLKSLFH